MPVSQFPCQATTNRFPNVHSDYSQTLCGTIIIIIAKALSYLCWGLLPEFYFSISIYPGPNPRTTVLIPIIYSYWRFSLSLLQYSLVASTPYLGFGPWVGQRAWKATYRHPAADHCLHHLAYPGCWHRIYWCFLLSIYELTKKAMREVITTFTSSFCYLYCVLWSIFTFP